MSESMNVREVIRVVSVCILVVVAAPAVQALQIGEIGLRANDPESAEYEISGTILGGDGNAAPGILVALSGDGVNQKAVTDAEGRFRFTKLQAGDYSLLFKVKGAKKVKRDVSVTDGDVDLGTISAK